ncbi:MAG: site-2 protease family protein [Planctomycetales bacterium]|nr:site-2 protease family protein [Planctomycetales bacterium]
MFLQDPPPTPYDLRFSVFGIPVRVHPWFWAIALMLGLNPRGQNRPDDVLIWIVAVFVSILIHELGHAFAARACGWPPRITLYAMGGLASFSPTYHDSKRQIAISAAGPAAGFLFAAVVIGLLVGFGYMSNVFGVQITDRPTRVLDNARLVTLINDLLWINVGWGVINLMPVIPLDGGHIATEVLATISPMQGRGWALLLSAVTGAALAVAGLVYLQSIFVALMFGYLAYQSYTAWQGRYAGGRW